VEQEAQEERAKKMEGSREEQEMSGDWSQQPEDTKRAAHESHCQGLLLIIILAPGGSSNHSINRKKQKHGEEATIPINLS
jgi:hypothetical protein